MKRIADNNLSLFDNYEQEIINRYEEWESELNEREAILKAREAELGIVAE